MTRVMVVASGGGHWEQAMLLREVFEDFNTLYVTTLPGLFERCGITRGMLISDCNRHNMFGTLCSAYQAIATVRQFRPDFVISTGAAPGLLCLLAGRLFGARTVWIDSIANVEKLSLSGRLALCCASLCLTQWRHIAKPNGPIYAGEVL